MQTDFLALVLASTMIVPPGCATADRNAYSVTEGLQTNGAGLIELDGLKIEHVIYRDVEHAENRALQLLLKAGIVPVLVRIENVGTTRQRIDPAAFSLRDELGDLAAVPPNDMPQEIDSATGERQTVGHNRASNIAAGILILFIVVILVAALGGKGGGGGGGLGGCCGGSGSGGDSTVSTIDYRKAFLKPRNLKAGATAEGLIFYRSTDRREPRWESLALDFNAPAPSD